MYTIVSVHAQNFHTEGNVVNPGQSFPLLMNEQYRHPLPNEQPWGTPLPSSCFPPPQAVASRNEMKAVPSSRIPSGKTLSEEWDSFSPSLRGSLPGTHEPTLSQQCVFYSVNMLFLLTADLFVLL